MTPLEIALQVTQAAAVVLEMYKRYARGELTAEEFRAEWAAYEQKERAANEAWERAGE